MGLATQLYVADGVVDAVAEGGRSAERLPLGTDATLRGSDARAVDAIVHDLSTTGCLIEARVRLPVGTSVSIGISGVGRRTAAVVRSDPRGFGCAFDRPIPDEAVAAARAADTVVAWTGAALPFATAESTMPAADRWPRAARLAIIAAGVATSWGIIGMAIATI